jgi:succinoglycan biosynthesis protein ExoU
MPMSDRIGCVDVLIAVFNNANTVERAIRSALSDAHVSNVIVVDDGSTDLTPSVVRSLEDEVGERLTFLQLDRNQGPSAARNRGLDLSGAPWVAILDGDDYLLPGRFAALLDASDATDIVADDQLQVKEEDASDPVVKGEPLVGNVTLIALDLATFVANNLSKRKRERKEFGFLKPIIRRSFLDSHQLRYDENLRLGEDFILYAKALAAGAAFKVVPFRTYVSIVRSNSVSGSHSKRDLEQLRESSKHLARSNHLTTSERELVLQHSDSIDARIQWLNVIDAVKSRSLIAFVSPFFTRWTTCVFLLERLWEQVVLRSRRLLASSSTCCGGCRGPSRG